MLEEAPILWPSFTLLGIVVTMSLFPPSLSLSFSSSLTVARWESAKFHRACFLPSEPSLEWSARLIVAHRRTEFDLFPLCLFSKEPYAQPQP